MFIHLYENGYNNEIDFVLPYINARVKEYKDNPLDSMNRDFVPLLITRYLMSKDYVFEHKYFIEEAIKKHNEINKDLLLISEILAI